MTTYKNKFSISVLVTIEGQEQVRPAGEIVLDSAEYAGATEADALRAARPELEIDTAANLAVFRGQLVPLSQFAGLKVSQTAVVGGMIPPALAPVPAPLLPAPAPVPLLEAPVTPRGSKSFNHVSGAVTGLTAYADLNACAWYAGGGWDLRNGRKLRPRGLSGAEDSNERRG